MSKTGEKTENRLEMVFMTKDQIECVFKYFVHKNPCHNKISFNNNLVLMTTKILTSQLMFY